MENRFVMEMIVHDLLEKLLSYWVRFEGMNNIQDRCGNEDRFAWLAVVLPMPQSRRLHGRMFATPLPSPWPISPPQ